MASQPFFSICIAAYNADRYIGRCLQSIANQSYSSYEVIVVDDGSSNPLRIAPEYRDKVHSLRLVRQKNSGPYHARRHAFDLALGKYLLALDADDELADNSALSKLHDSLSCGVDVVFYNAVTDQQPHQRLLNYEGFSNRESYSFDEVFPMLLSSCSLNALWNKAFSKEAYLASKDTWISPCLAYAEDRLQTFEIMTSAKSYKVLDDILYVYRINPGSTTNSSFRLEYLEQQLFVESKIVAYCKSASMSLDSWSTTFLRSVLTNVKLLGFNTGLTCCERKQGYELVADSDVFWESVRRANPSSLSIEERLLSHLLQHQQYGLLWLYTFAVACASRVKSRVLI